jgi:hypothetical protein
MAYPTVSAPYGLLAVNRVDGLPYAGAIRQIPIASTYNTPIYYGDIVRIAAGGTIQKSTVTVDSTTAAANNTVGVFVGCQFVNSQSQQVQGQAYISNTAQTSAIAYVVDDPLALFKVAVTNTNGNGAMSSVNQSIVGTNMAIVQGTGSNTTGDSAVSVFATTAQGNAAALPVRVIAGVPDTETVTGLYTEVLVKINNHQYNNASALNYTA